MIVAGSGLERKELDVELDMVWPGTFFSYARRMHRSAANLAREVGLRHGA